MYRKHLFFLTILFSLSGCAQKSGTKGLLSLDALPHELLESTGINFFKDYNLDANQNPFYLSVDLDRDPMPDYVLFLLRRKDHLPIIAIIVNGKMTLKPLDKFSGTNAPLEYCKQTEHFPAGSSLPPNIKGLIMGFRNGEIRWVFLDEKRLNIQAPR